jgi:uncharacterized protein
MEAAGTCDLARVRKLLAAGASLKQMVTASQNAVTEAAFGWGRGFEKPEAVRLKVIQELVAAGCPVEGNALFRPIDQEELKILKFLIKEGAAVNVESPRARYFIVPKGICPLWVAIQLKRLKPLRLLIKAGANVNQVTGPIWRFGAGSRAPLIYWASDFPEAVPLMKKAGVDFEAQSSFGYTALLYAVQANYYETVKALIAAGANVNTRGKVGFTPLEMARTSNHQKIEQLLLKAGAKE